MPVELVRERLVTMVDITKQQSKAIKVMAQLTPEQRGAIRAMVREAYEYIEELEELVKAAQAVDAANEGVNDNPYDQMGWNGQKAVSLHDILLDGVHVLNEALLKGTQP